MSRGMNGAAAYRAAYQASRDDPETFWLEQARLVDWVEPPTRALDATTPPFFRWFPDATLNTCFNAVDRHVSAGNGDHTAVIYDSPVTGSNRVLTFRQLLDEVARLAGLLGDLGVGKGDRVVAYMPMIPEAVVAMLACARIGAIHSVVFGGFAAQELAARIDDCEPSVILSASCGMESNRVIDYKPILDRALELSRHRPRHCVIKQRPQATALLIPGRDLDWDTELRSAEPALCVPVAATDPLYILYTSGTTGNPKGIVRDNGGHAVAMAWSLANIYDIGPGQVWWAASDVGWVVGHSYIVYAPLVAGATTVLYEGKPVGTPDAGAFWRVISEHRVEGLFTAPTAIRAIKKEDPDGGLADHYDLSCLRNVFLAGERLDPDTYRWAGEVLGVPVVDNWWQTETGWPIASSLRGLAPLPTKAGSPSQPVPGFQVEILDQAGYPVGAGVEGTICLKLPLPPGTLSTLWQDDKRYVSSYLAAFPGHYLSGDGGYFDDDGYLYVMGRTDDVINVAGHRLSTGALEAVVSSHPAVAECAVIGLTDDLKGQVPHAFVVMKSKVGDDPDTVLTEIAARIRDEIGAIAALKGIVTLSVLPKTRSGKVLRKTMREIADGGNPPMPATIEDPAALAHFREVVRPGDPSS
ncbi:propionyl-CoA synthetase [Nocardia rhamnosiphila]|uniref:Propionyl-CoA synthetase n=1 Tax=Nocardia rhamnosiphila TaxID=426716 RepID=A0ABV2WYT5_9NOCA